MLEVGVGTGISLPQYASHLRIFGTDISEAMLRKAKRRAADLHLKNVEGLSVMDAEKLEFLPWTSPADFMRQVAKVWLAVGIGGLLFRTVHLFFIRDVETGLVWMTKILTDPFSDLRLYYKAPLYLLKGELIDPGLDLIDQGLEEKLA